MTKKLILCLFLGVLITGCLHSHTPISVTPEDSYSDLIDVEDLDPRELSDFTTLQSTCFTLMSIFAGLGAVFLVVSTFIGGLGRNAGFVLVLLSAAFGSAPFVIIDLVTNVWFKAFVYSLTSGTILYAVWHSFSVHKELKSNLTEDIKPPQ